MGKQIFRDSAKPRSRQRVTAFQCGDDPALRVFIRDDMDLMGYPGKILFDQVQARHIILGMGIEIDDRHALQCKPAETESILGLHLYGLLYIIRTDVQEFSGS